MLSSSHADDLDLAEAICEPLAERLGEKDIRQLERRIAEALTETRNHRICELLDGIYVQLMNGGSYAAKDPQREKDRAC